MAARKKTTQRNIKPVTLVAYVDGKGELLVCLSSHEKKLLDVLLFQGAY